MKKKIAVLLGGISAEKNVSLKTGKYVSKSLKQQGYKVKEIKVTKNERDLIKNLATKNIGIILASHILSEVEKTCTHVLILNKGKTLIKEKAGSPSAK